MTGVDRAEEIKASTLDRKASPTSKAFNESRLMSLMLPKCERHVYATSTCLSCAVLQIPAAFSLERCLWSVYHYDVFICQSVIVFDIAIFVLKRDVKLQLTNCQSVILIWILLFISNIKCQLVKFLTYRNDGCLHFAWVIDHEKCIVVTRVCVSVCPRPHAYTIARTRM